MSSFVIKEAKLEQMDAGFETRNGEYLEKIVMTVIGEYTSCLLC